MASTDSAHSRACLCEAFATATTRSGPEVPRTSSRVLRDQRICTAFQLVAGECTGAAPMIPDSWNTRGPKLTLQGLGLSQDACLASPPAVPGRTHRHSQRHEALGPRTRGPDPGRHEHLEPRDRPAPVRVWPVRRRPLRHHPFGIHPWCHVRGTREHAERVCRHEVLPQYVRRELELRRQ